MKLMLNSVGNVEGSIPKAGFWVGVGWDWILVMGKGN